MRFQQQAIKIFYFCYSNVFQHEITEEHFLECFKVIKSKKDFEDLTTTFQAVTMRDFASVLKLLPEETIKKVDEILLLNSLSFTKRIFYKLFKLFKNVSIKKTI